jgi:hypothetical protein
MGFVGGIMDWCAKSRSAVGGFLSSAQYPEVSVLEAVVVLEAVAQKVVEADVGQPDEAQGQDQRPVLPPA